MEQFSGSLKLYMTLRLRQWILDQMRTDHQMHTGWHLANKQWGNSWSGYTGVFDWYFPINTSQVCAVCLTKHTQKVSSGHNWEPARIEQWSNSFVRIRPDGDLGYSVIVIGLA